MKTWLIEFSLEIQLTSISIFEYSVCIENIYCVMKIGNSWYALTF